MQLELVLFSLISPVRYSWHKYMVSVVRMTKNLHDGAPIMVKTIGGEAKR